MLCSSVSIINFVQVNAGWVNACATLAMFHYLLKDEKFKSVKLELGRTKCGVATLIFDTIL